MNVIHVPKYNIDYRVNPRDPFELQWAPKAIGPGTQWQHAYTFNKPIRALDIDDDTQTGVVILNEGSTYLSQGTRSFARKFYPAGSRIFSLYQI